MKKNYCEEYKIEDLPEHINGVLDKLQSIVVIEIYNDFIMALEFIESSMVDKDFKCLK